MRTIPTALHVVAGAWHDCQAGFFPSAVLISGKCMNRELALPLSLHHWDQGAFLCGQYIALD